MASVRYTAGGDYDPNASLGAKINGSFDEAVVIGVRRDGNFYEAILQGEDPISIRDEETSVLLNSATSGFFVDFSDKGSSVSLEGGNLGDILRAGVYDDLLNGGNGDDTLDGGDGFNTVNGGQGADVIYSSGAGTYDGGENDDLMFSGLGAETMEGGSGIDTIDHSVFFGDYDFNMTFSTTQFGESFSGFENAVMGAGNDTVTGTSLANQIIGAGGDDRVFARSGDDTAAGGGGADLVAGGVWNDTLHGDFLAPQTPSTRGLYHDLDGGFAFFTDARVQDADANPHVTVTGVGDGANPGRYALTVIEGSFVTIDIDQTSAGYDSWFAVYRADGTVIFDADDNGENAGVIDAGSYTSFDSFKSYTVDAESAGVIYIDVGRFNDGAFDPVVPTGATYTLNVSVTTPASLDPANAPGADTLFGGLGSDSLSGGAGADLLFGDDRLVNPSAGQVTKAAGLGNSAVDTAVFLDGTYSLASNPNIANSTSVRHVTVSGTGDGTVDYYAFTVTAANGQPSVFDLDAGSFDTSLTLFDAAGNILARNEDDSSDPGSNAFDAAISYTFGSAGTYYLAVSQENVASDFDVISAGGTYQLHVSLQNPTLTRTGGADTLMGGLGNDTLDGGAGLDTADWSDADGDIVFALTSRGGGVTADVSGIGRDTLISIENLAGGFGNDSLSGNGAANVLSGGFGADSLSGQGGADRLIGGIGNDTLNGGVGADTADWSAATSAIVFALDASGGGVTADVSGIGQDTAIGIENLTGGSAADRLTGNGAANVLNGGGGADQLYGLGGADAYVVDSSSDRVFEEVGGGADVVTTSVGYRLLAGQEIETLQLAANVGNGVFNLTGNEFRNVLIGSAGINTLDGGLEADRMTGGAGDDRYLVDTSGDVVIEARGGGTDTVTSTASYVLRAGQEVETVQLATTVGSGPFNLTGNEFGQTLRGSAGANVLTGGGGNDRLFGLGGADNFIFDAVANSRNLDAIADFVAADDTIRLDQTAFGALTVGRLAASAYKDIGDAGAVVDGDDRIIYDHRSGALFYDSNGSGGGGRIQFALLENKPLVLTNADFVVIA